MNKLYKTTLLITMAVVTWKVIKIESYLRPRKLKINSNLNFLYPLKKKRQLSRNKQTNDLMGML